ncbi:iduronate 2-sulfatase-like [Uloborus diversus]|uniref:iduronate 2-sulfatase-like n=1 Tax=Uloborus diversus TaxID=327109 RepID=UPI002408F57A|nr:iduronate 2-sulfatase-like [Uloborus diversus]
MTVVSERTLQQRHTFLFIFICVIVIAVIGVTISVLLIHPPQTGEDDYIGRTNILFIVVDDLRPALGCYGDKKAITPNIDFLASKSVIFKNAFAQQALCAPSRTSFLTSRRPDTLHLYDAGSYWRDTVGNFITIPQLFKNHGYETISIGKVFHHGSVSNYTDDYPYSWTEYPYRPPTQKWKMKPVCPSADGKKRMNLVCPVEVENQPGESLPDIENTNYAIQYLRNKSMSINRSTPFFLGVGFYKPHIPFKFPKAYLDLYPIESMDLAPNSTIPSKMPKVSWNPWTDIRERDDVKNLNVSFPYGPLPTNFQKLARQGYYASLSYMDDQLGKLLEVLEETGYAKHTAIVLFGDHGWSLGEHQEWSKYSNFEVSLKVPLIVHVPDLTETSNKRKPFKHVPVLDMIGKENAIQVPKYVSEDLVELVDVFPTLSEIANIAVPPLCKNFTSDFCSEGISFYPVIQHLVYDPWVEFSWKTATFSQYPRPSIAPRNNSDQPKLKDIIIMGYSIRTKHFRYTEWVKFDNQACKPDRAVIVSRELYDHRTDPFEVVNVSDVESYANTVIELSRRIKKGWRNALPPGLFDSPKYVDPATYVAEKQ